jgi:hypothetical protein
VNWLRWAATMTSWIRSHIMERSVSSAEAGEDFRGLSLDGLKGAGGESEQLQDRRSDLARFHPVARLASLDGARRIDDERNVPIAWVIAPVFGDLRAGRVYRDAMKESLPRSC